MESGTLGVGGYLSVFVVIEFWRDADNIIVCFTHPDENMNDSLPAVIQRKKEAN